MSKLRTHRRARRALALALVLTGGLVALAAYAYARYIAVERYTTVNGRLTVQARAIDGLGTVLVTNKGYALYSFPPDHRKRVTCTGGCATGWPPLVVPAGAHLVAGQGVNPSLLGTIPRPGGGRVATYHGWPLYTYLGDADPLQAAGQGKDDDGGYWYVLRPSGHVVTSPRS